MLEESVAAFQSALEERTLEREPMTWAMTMANLCAVRKALAEQLADAGLAHRVQADFRAVGEVFRSASHAQYYELVTEQVALTRKLEERLIHARDTDNRTGNTHGSG